MFKPSQILAIASALLVAMSSPAAALAATYTVTSTDDSGAGTLRDTIGGTVDGDEVVLPSSGTAYSVTSGVIDINHSISIQGGGQETTTIDGGNTSQIFHVASGVTASISDVTMQHGISADSGAVTNEGTTTISNSTLKDNVGTYGGAIHNAGTMTISNSTLTGNFGDGAAIYNNGNLSISGSTLSGNSGSGYTGAIRTTMNAVSNDTSLTVTNSTIDSNDSHGIYSTGSEVSIQGSTFSNNNGVGIVASSGDSPGNNPTLSVVDSSVTSNSDGGIDSSVDATISGTTISSNGAGIYQNYAFDPNDTLMTIIDSIIDSNLSDGLTNNVARVTISGSTISNNVGKGIESDGGQIQATDTDIINNQSAFFVEGGGVSLYYYETPGDSTFQMQGGSISGNSAGRGGAVSAYGSAVSLTDVSVSGNSAQQEGGAFFINYAETIGDASLSISGGSVTDNTSGQTTSFLYSHGANLTLGGTISGHAGEATLIQGGAVNVADATYTGNGGGLRIEYADDPSDVSLNITGSTISNNDANSYAPVFFRGNNDVAVTSSTISGNTGNYAGLYLTPENNYCGNLTITDSTISTNTGLDAGGVFADCYDTIIQGSEISGNTADNNNGGGGFNGTGNLAISDSTISGNEVGTSATGAGIFSGYRGWLDESPHTITITNSTIDNNVGGYGGGIYLDGNSLVVTGGSIRGNTAQAGGGVYAAAAVDQTNSVAISGTDLSNNTANNTTRNYDGQLGRGGALFLEGATSLSLIDSILDGNSAISTAYGMAQGSGVYLVSSNFQRNNNIFGTVTIQGSTLDNNDVGGNGFGIQGGVVYLDPGFSLTLTNSSISGATADSQGGAVDGAAVFMQGSAEQAQLSMTGTTIENNVATGESINVVSAAWTDVAIGGSSLSGNTLNSNYFIYGGVLYNNGTLTIEDSNFDNNTINFSNTGGSATGATVYNSFGIDPTAQVQITDSSFSGNVVNFTDYGSIGGNLYIQAPLAISGSHFDHNNFASGGIGSGQGGGLYLDSTNYDPYTVTVTDSTFNDNDVGYGMGGAIYSNSVGLDIQNTQLNDNRAGNSGAINISASLSLTDSQLNGNTASNEAGAIEMANGDLTILRSSLDNNTAGQNGGAVEYEAYDADHNVTITDSDLSGNNSASYGGGGLYILPGNGVTVTTAITGSTLSNNTVGDGYGGALYVKGPLAIIDSVLNGNSTTGLSTKGGAIYQEDTNQSDATLDIQNSILDGNSTQDQGGAVYTEVLNPTISDSSLSNNSAAAGGALFHQSEGQTTLTRVTMDGNAVHQYDNAAYFSAVGGALYDIGLVSITDSSLSHNTTSDAAGAGPAGAAIYLNTFDPGQTLTIQGSHLDYNTVTGDADYEQVLGGIIFSRYSTLALQGSTLEYNSVNLSGNGSISAYGALIYLSANFNDGATLTFDNTSVSHNSVSVVSGDQDASMYALINLSNYEENIADSHFDYNTVTLSGVYGSGNGVIYQGNKDLNISNSSFDGNSFSTTADADQGGYFSLDGIALTHSFYGNEIPGSITGSSFSNNSATFDTDGGYVVGTVQLTSAFNIGNSHFDNNDYHTGSTGTTSVGGGLYSSGIDSYGVVVSDSTFNGNRLPVNDYTYGGGIFSGNILTLIRSTVNDNTAGYSGGGIEFEGSLLTLDHTTVDGNVSQNYGGGISSYGDDSITASTISNNTSANGGGVYRSGGHLTLAQSTINGNQAQTGGGLYIDDSGNTTLTNSTIAQNSGSVSGGGIYANQDFALNGVTVAGNSAPDGGGIAGADQATVHNSIVATNTGGDCDLAVTDNGYNLDSDGDCFTAATSLHGNPGLGPLQDNGGPTKTMAINTNTSLAFNAGDPNDCQATDQRGEPRPALGGCDMGAYEAQTLTPTPLPSNPTSPAPTSGANVESVTEEGLAPVTLAAATQPTVKKAKKIAANAVSQTDESTGLGEGKEKSSSALAKLVHKVATFLTDPLTVTFSSFFLLLLLLLLVRRHRQDQPA